MKSEQLFELRRRTFDTPHFRGIEFIEVGAKSIVNHVPGTYLPFNWSILDAGPSPFARPVLLRRKGPLSSWPARHVR